MAASRCTSACYVTFIIFSLFSHLAELIFSAILALTLYRDVIHRDVFFSLTSGLLILPLVLVQLVSAVFLLRRRGDNMSGGQVGQMALLHLLQLGFVWRHLTLLRHNNNSSSSSNNNNNNNNSNVSTASTESRGSRNDLAELLTLRLVFTFVGGFPLVLIQLYLVVNGAGYDLSWPWALYGALSASVVSTTWALASYQRRTTISSQCSSSSCDECSSCASSALSADGSHLLSWPGSLFRILWRGGELVSRVISLTLFASLYHQWVFLVLGLHWLVMLLCLSLPQAFTDHSPRRSSSSFSSSPSCGPKAVWCVVTSYSYVFAYVNTSRARAAVWYTLYYVIMFLENGTLSIVWMTKSVADSFTARYLLVFISTLAFVAAVVCLTVYYKYFHLPATSLMCHHHLHHQDESSKPPGIVISGCCSEDLNPCGNGNGNASACKHHHYPHHNPHHHQRLQPCQNANGVIAATTSSSGPANPTVGWVNQYHSALTAGQYYKHAMHDSLLDSTSDLASMTTGSGIALAGGRPRSRHPKMGLNGPASSSLDSVVGVGLRRGTTTLATQNCCGCCRSDGYGSAGCQDADATSLASCQTSRSVASFPQSQHHHHHHHKHGPHNHNNHNSRRCQLKTCSRSDLTDTTSVLTVASGASHNLGSRTCEGTDRYRM